MRGIENHLGEFQALGVRPVAISVDLPEQSRKLCSRRGYSYLFLSDPSAEAIRRYDVFDPDEGPHGIARPAEFLIDRSGNVRWVNLTGDIRVRARPEQLLAAAKRL